MTSRFQKLQYRKSIEEREDDLLFALLHRSMYPLFSDEEKSRYNHFRRQKSVAESMLFQINCGMSFLCRYCVLSDRHLTSLLHLQKSVQRSGETESDFYFLNEPVPQTFLNRPIFSSHGFKAGEFETELIFSSHVPVMQPLDTQLFSYLKSEDYLKVYNQDNSPLLISPIISDDDWFHADYFLKYPTQRSFFLKFLDSYIDRVLRNRSKAEENQHSLNLLSQEYLIQKEFASKQMADFEDAFNDRQVESMIEDGAQRLKTL